MHKLETGKETVKKTAETVISAIDYPVFRIFWITGGGIYYWYGFR